VELDNDDYYMRAAKEAGERVGKILKQEGAQAKALFDRIAERHGLDTAKLLFELCIRLAREPSIEEQQEARAAALAKTKPARRSHELTKWPTMEEVVAADRKKICNLWARLPDRKYSAQEKRIYNLLLQRYVEERLTPIKKRGSITRNSPNAKLPAVFDRAFSELVAKLGRKPKQDEVAEAIMSKHGNRYGGQVDNVIANWKYWRKKKI
jgi:hypothetical protein